MFRGIRKANPGRPIRAFEVGYLGMGGGEGGIMWNFCRALI